MKIRDLKVGSRLILGKSRTGVFDWVANEKRINEISWLKASKDSVFISEFAVEEFVFDAREGENPNMNFRYYGNPDYSLSNIFSYLNNSDLSWFTPKHEFDASSLSEREHPTPGFLYLFEDYEREGLISSVNLPQESDIFGDDRLELFKRKGIRPRNIYHPSSFDDYWLSTPAAGSGNLVKYINRSGTISAGVPSAKHGLRPICRLDPDLEIIPSPRGMGYMIKSFSVSDDGFFSDDDLLKFLGIRQP